MDELKESLDQKRRELAMQAPVREKKGSAEEGRRYGAQEEWKREEMRRLRQQTKRDQNKRAHKKGRGEGRNRISSPSGTLLRDRSDSSGDEELRRALELSCQEVEGMGGRHGEELEEDKPDMAFALAVSMEEYRVQLHVPRVATRRSSEEDLQEALRRSRLETGSEQEQKGRGEGRDRVSSPSGAPLRASANIPAEPPPRPSSPRSSNPPPTPA